jgi:peptidoglycan/LPS O-acetylase OafA/YrhL
MSGAIFVKNYEIEIRENRVSFNKFIIKRFARLYPLHLFTLLTVALLQFVMISSTGRYFIYDINDIYHLILHLFFASHWGFEKGNSFNSPVWSVSHEIVLYGIFFLACILSRWVKFLLILFVIIAIIIPLLKLILINFILNSAFAFFLGCIIYYLLIFIFKISNKIHLRILILCFIGIIYLLSRYFEKNGLPFGFIGPLILIIAITIDFIFLSKLNPIFLNKLEFLGRISYSSYLIHFPFQILLALINIYIVKIDFSSNFILFLYVFFILILSTVSFIYLERPMQNAIKSKFGIKHEKN